MRGVTVVSDFRGEAVVAPSFSDLFNARCTHLGLLSAAEVAQRIIEVQPATGRTDLARSVRNWQAGRNVPRPDYYRIILQAFRIEQDAELCQEWHQAYSDARAERTGRNTPEHTTGGADNPLAEPRERTEVSASKGNRTEERVDGSRRSAIRDKEQRTVPGSAQRLRPMRWAVLAAAVLVIAGVAALAIGRSDAAAAGQQCDEAAGARWDSNRNAGVSAPDYLDIRHSAIETCETAVQHLPRNGRQWFQLGRAHDRDAKWHGNYAMAYWAFRRAHALGYPAATLNLGFLYEDGLVDVTDGREREPNLRKAASFYAQAADAGLPMGHYCHAIATLFGWSGNDPDPESATRAAETAVAAGANRALSLVADLRAKVPQTKHVECSQEYGRDRPPQTIAWKADPMLQATLTPVE